MVKCWARPLGDCGGGQSREHIISKSQFEDDKITVSGLPWCPSPVTVGLASLVAKNLCVDHNNRLSPADKEALIFRLSVTEWHRARILPVRVTLDARLIEQWLLKTTINLSLQSPDSGLAVTPDLVRRAFGLLPTPPKEGFFAVAEQGEQLDYGGGLRFETFVHRTTNRLALAGFRLHGWRALYAFERAPEANGAMRVKEWATSAHWLRFRWRPDFDKSDGVMQPLSDADREAG